MLNLTSFVCPDCGTTDTELLTDAVGIDHLFVYHDPTCPLYGNRAQRRRARKGGQ